MPLIKRLPKRGFNSSKSIDYTSISVADIEVLVAEKRVGAHEVLNKAQLVSVGYIKSEKTPVKLRGGSVKMKFKIYKMHCTNIFLRAIFVRKENSHHKKYVKITSF